MAAYAALVSLMNTMNQILNHPRISILFHTQEMRSLFETVGFLQDFIERSGTNCHRGMSKQIEEDLESQIAFAAHAAEDVIETHIAGQILAGSTKRSLRLLFDLQKITEDMDSIKEKLVNMDEERGSGDLHLTRSSAAVIPSKYLTIGKSIMVGFDDELMELMDVLTGQRSSRQIISIVGMGGTGKTTLARHVYESSLIVEHFDIRAWTTISQEYNVSEILVQLLSLQGKFTNETVHELGEQLYKSLSGRRYLIILDDMWSVEVWNSIKFFFPDNGNGSRVVLTTRLSNIATHLGSFCLRINFLDESKSWILFCQKVFGQGDCQAELLGIGKKIVEQCKGHALSIVVIGGLLRKSHRTEEYWRNVARNMNSILISGENACLDVLYLSYNHLSPCLKPCFLHMGTFREDYEIRVSRVIKLWVAMGFIKPNGVQMLEEIAEDHIRDLIDRNLIIVCRYRSNGKIKSCRMHDLLREVCLMVANKEKFLSVVREHSSPLGVDMDWVEGPITRRSVRVVSKDFDWHVKDEFQNVNLRYIAYIGYWQGIMFPSSIPLVWNLQTLVVKTDGIIAAPLEIWKMPQLRHLKWYRIMLPDPPQSDKDDDSVVLGNLQTLEVVVNFRLSEEVCKRIPNIKKLHLVFGSCWKGYNDGLYHNLQNLFHLHKLESLNIWFFNPISSNELKTTFPVALNKLCLKGFNLGSIVFSLLPQLEVLKLEDCFSEFCQWSCVEGEFPHLKFLHVEDWSLKSWTSDSSSCLPILEKLVLTRLWELDEIPSCIGEIPTLQLIRLEDCSESAMISAMKIKEEQDSFGNDGLQVQVMITTKKGETRFRERVELEELSINNVHLESDWRKSL